jgi:hypothetical protein
MMIETWPKLVERYVEEETCDQTAWETEWPDRLSMAWERVCLQLVSDDVEPEFRQNSLAYVAAWCEIAMRAEEERKGK